MNLGGQSADSCCELEECCHAFVKVEEGNLPDEGEREQMADERSGVQARKPLDHVVRE